jgi:hypothetical protein
MTLPNWGAGGYLFGRGIMLLFTHTIAAEVPFPWFGAGNAGE